MKSIVGQIVEIVGWHSNRALFLCKQQPGAGWGYVNRDRGPRSGSRSWRGWNPLCHSMRSRSRAEMRWWHTSRGETAAQHPGMAVGTNHHQPPSTLGRAMSGGRHGGGWYLHDKLRVCICMIRTPGVHFLPLSVHFLPLSVKQPVP